jgi:sulfatase maturation enzyme AslB (radical SAM superfamily)
MSDFWCPLPWIHQFVEPTGIKTCCQGRIKLPVSPLDFSRSEFVNDVQTHLLNNQVHNNCQNCYELEQQGFDSTRLEAIRDYPLITKERAENKVEYLDLRYNNLCNFSCRTCEPAFSSSIVKELEHQPALRKWYVTSQKTNQYDKIVDDLNIMLPTVKKINFTGGEPLLIKENLIILNKLEELSLFDCEILITTNASVINPKWLEILKKFNRVHWTISIDATESWAEYIRYGTIWSTVDENIKTILSLGHSVAFNTTLSAYSVLAIDQTVQYFLNLKKDVSTPFEHWFHVCVWPKHLHPSVLKNEFAQTARKKLTYAIQLLNTTDSNPLHSVETLKNLIITLNTSSDKLTDDFYKFTQQLDAIRGQSIATVSQKTYINIDNDI